MPAVIALCLLAAGCGGSAARPSTLQRYQALAPRLSAASIGSSTLAADAARLERALARAWLGQIQRQDAVLRDDAMALEGKSGRAAAGIRPLLGTRQSSRVREYLRAVLAGLSFQWAEADRMIHAADVLRWDPWLRSGDNARRFKRYVATARGNAWQSVLSARRAAALRVHYRKAFRYVPVKQDNRPAQAAEAGDRSTG